MATYKTFREFPLWNDSVDFAAEIYKFCENGSLRTDFRMRDQLRAAACSISNNIAEGFEYNHPPSFIRFLLYSKGSASEVFNQFTILYRAGLISLGDYENYSTKALSLGNRIGGLIKYLSGASTHQSTNPSIHNFLESHR